MRREHSFFEQNSRLKPLALITLNHTLQRYNYIRQTAKPDDHESQWCPTLMSALYNQIPVPRRDARRRDSLVQDYSNRQTPSHVSKDTPN